MNFEEEVIKRIAPELYEKVRDLQKAVDSLKADFEGMRHSLSSMQDTLLDVNRVLFEMKGRYEGVKNEVKQELLSEMQREVIKEQRKRLKGK